MAIYSKRSDGRCGWCEEEPALPLVDALGTKYYACFVCFEKHATHDVDRVVLNMPPMVGD